MQAHGPSQATRDPTTGRYLTPGKIALLALISLYTESKIPSPSTIPILTFILHNLIPTKDTLLLAANTPPAPSITLDSIRQLTIHEPSAVTGRTLYDLLLRKLWSINSYDSLHTFISSLESHLADPKKAEKTYIRSSPSEKSYFTRTSVLGAFIRRAILEWSRMPFAETTHLWLTFITYREPSLSQWRKRNSSLVGMVPGGGVAPITEDLFVHDQFLSGLPNDHPLVRHLYGEIDSLKAQGERAPGMIAVDDLEKLLEFQVDTMQRLGARIPEAMAVQLRGILDSRAMKPNLQYYVDFLNAWRSGDYQGSFEYLHQYFDYTMHTRDRTFYQYALLNLAILQADFGCNRESIIAMQETVNTARENKDIACLNFALSWLYHFHKLHPADCPSTISARMERESLSFLKVKAKEAGMHHLQSMAHLSEAKQALTNAESLGFAFESLMRSSYLNITKGIHNAFGSQMMLQSAVWSRLGVAAAAIINCELFVGKYAKYAPTEDMVKAQCRSAFLIAQRGRFDDALDRLDNIDKESLRTLRFYQYWAMYGGLIRLKRELSRGDLSAAGYALHQLLSSSSTNEADCLIEIQLCKVQLMLRRNNYSSALDALQTLSDELAKDKGDISSRLRIMLTKAQILGKCNRAVRGLSLVLRAASIAWRAKLLPVLYLAVGVLGGILVALHEFDVAYSLVDAIMPSVVECEDPWLAGVCLGAMVDAAVGLAGTVVVGPPGQTMGPPPTPGHVHPVDFSGAKDVDDGDPGRKKRREYLNRALELIELCSTEYGKLGDRFAQAELMNKKARVNNLLGNWDLRNEAAQVSLQLKKGF